MRIKEKVRAALAYILDGITVMAILAMAIISALCGAFLVLIGREPELKGGSK